MVDLYQDTLLVSGLLFLSAGATVSVWKIARVLWARLGMLVMGVGWALAAGYYGLELWGELKGGSQDL
jgi:hypothetical protein